MRSTTDILVIEAKRQDLDCIGLKKKFEQDLESYGFPRDLDPYNADFGPSINDLITDFLIILPKRLQLLLHSIKGFAGIVKHLGWCHSGLTQLGFKLFHSHLR